MNSNSQDSFLSSGQRFFWLGVNLFLGLLPGAAFFVWVERNAALPYLPISWGWPWVSLAPWLSSINGDFHWSGALVQSLWNIGLFLLFGGLHTALAQPGVQARLFRMFPPQAHRTVYLAASGLSLLLMMGLWQNTGRILWALPFGWETTYLLSIGIYWLLMACSISVIARFDPLEFVGLKQIYQRRSGIGRGAGTPRLLQTGFYARSRHPVYTFTLLAFLVTPVMTLDRALVFLATCIYLYFAIPIEERKLVALFGQAYEDYRQRVPAIIPAIFR